MGKLPVSGNLASPVKAFHLMLSADVNVNVSEK